MDLFYVTAATPFISESSIWYLISEEIKMHKCSEWSVVGAYELVFMDLCLEMGVEVYQ